MSKLLCSVHELQIAYGEHTVLSQLSFQIHPGECVVLSGPSGFGKTSVAHAILGLIPYTGSIDTYGVKIGMVFQENRLCEGFRVIDNLRMVSPDVTPDEITTMLDQFHLLECAKARVHTLSGGMKRRVALARAILYQPELLILDEPFTGLDYALRDDLLAYLRSWLTPSRAILLITHHPDEAAALQARSISLKQE